MLLSGKLGFKAKWGMVLLFPLLLTGVVGYVGVDSMGRINSMLDAMYDKNLVPIADVAGANIHAIHHNQVLFDLAGQTDEPIIAKLKAEITENEAKMRQSLDKYRKSDLTEKEKELLTRFDASWSMLRRSLKLTQVCSQKADPPAVAEIGCSSDCAHAPCI